MEVKTILSCLLLLTAGFSESYKILGIFHTFSKSHYIAGAALMTGLAAKGHNVTVISPFRQEKPIKNYHDVTVRGIDKHIEEMFPNMSEMDDMGIIDKMNLICNVGVLMTNYTLNHEVVQRFLLAKVQFDVVVMEIFMNEAFLGLGHHFQAPVVGFSTFGASKWSNDMVGNPTLMSYIPHSQVKFSDRMTFIQRVGNVLMYLGESVFMCWYYMARQEKIYNEFFHDPKPRLDELHKNVSLVLLNNHFSLHFPRPYVPNMIEVGGLQINRKPKKLPTDLQTILDDAEHGVIYFSLGTNVKAQYISVEKQRQILNVFRKLKQTVLWKWDEPLPQKVDNVFVNRWYPQEDLLAHPNVKLFITHGGLLSITETIYHAVPFIGIPLFADQFLNMAKAQRAGYALTIYMKELNEASLSTAITELLTNDKYSEQIKVMSNRYRDQPLTPLETAIYWTEYVARHKGAPHMRCAGLDLSFLAYHSLDVFGFLLCVVYMFWRLLKWACCELYFWKIGGNVNGVNVVKKNR